MNQHPVIVSLLILGAGIFALEFGISVAILEIIAGIIATNVFNVGHFPWIDFMADFGLLGIMFFAGFEVDGRLLRQTWRKSLRIGVISFFVPFTAVVAVTYFIFGFGLQTSLLIGIGLSTTSLALVYAVLKERGMLESQSSQILLSSAMVIDVISMIALSILFEGFTLRSLGTIVMILIGLKILPWIGKKIFQRYKHGDTIEFELRAILLLLLALGVFAEQAQVHVAVLAFFAGFLFTRLIEEHRELEQKLRGVVFGLFGPIFFFAAGSSISLDEIGIGTVALMASLGSLVFITKYIASNFALRRYFSEGIPRLGGLLFNFRLSFGIIVALFGLRSGLIDTEVYNAILGAVIALSILSEFLVRHELRRSDAAAAVE